MISLIDESSEAIADKSNPVCALKSLVPMKEFPLDLNKGFNFSDYYYERIGTKSIFPTADGDFIAISDAPFVLGANFPSLFTGGVFSKLLKLPQEKKSWILLGNLLLVMKLISVFRSRKYRNSSTVLQINGRLLSALLYSSGGEKNMILIHPNKIFCQT